MGFSSKTKRLKIDADLFEKLSSSHSKCGYSSADEMAEHLIRTGLTHLSSVLDEDTAATDEDRKLAEEQLRGLGYLK